MKTGLAAWIVPMAIFAIVFILNVDGKTQPPPTTPAVSLKTSNGGGVPTNKQGQPLNAKQQPNSSSAPTKNPGNISSKLESSVVLITTASLLMFQFLK